MVMVGRIIYGRWSYGHGWHGPSPSAMDVVGPVDSTASSSRNIVVVLAFISGDH